MILQQQVKSFIAEHELLAGGERVLVAVSGGPDSVALLHLLYEMAEDVGLRLEVAHVEHGMRGEEAKQDARFVAALAEKFNLPFHLKEVSVPQFRSAAGKGNLEQLAREARYRFFAEVARARQLNKVAIGHTLDDQAETALMRFLRGSGKKGLGGMSPRRPLTPGNDVELVRPLLAVTKAAVLEYLDEHRIEHRFDASNRDTSLLRNWVRLDLLPQLAARFDARLNARLARNSEMLRDEDEFLDVLARRELRRIRALDGIDRAAFLSVSKPMQRRVLRFWIEAARGHLRGIDLTHVDEFLRFVREGPPQGRLAIPGGWELLKEYDNLRVAKAARSQKALCYSYTMSLDCELRISEAAMTIRSERIVSPPPLPADLLQAIFDAADLPPSLIVRNFRRGDRIKPLGMMGHKKVKDLFIEKKVPLSIRKVLPLICAGDEVLWVPGYGRSAIGTVRAQTSAVVRLTALGTRA